LDVDIFKDSPHFWLSCKTQATSGWINTVAEYSKSWPAVAPAIAPAIAKTAGFGEGLRASLEWTAEAAVPT
jgi:hypothetical protein